MEKDNMASYKYWEAFCEEGGEGMWLRWKGWKGNSDTVYNIGSILQGVCVGLYGGDEVEVEAVE